MNNSQKLRIIQKASDLTQAQLAYKLGVSFATLNSWINGKSQPRKRASARINTLYRDITGETIIPISELRALKALLYSKVVRYPNILQRIIRNNNIYNQFILGLTYHSNRIEGSTLSENETAAILFSNISLPNKTLKEQLEAKNHQTSTEYLFNYLSDGNKINIELLLKLHSILLNGINSEAGSFRRSNVRILGANVPTANYLKIPDLMKDLFKDISRSKKDIIAYSTRIHAAFEQIHPFVDGNGRVGRLLLAAMLLKANLPPAIIKQENKVYYLKYLNKAQIESDTSLFEKFLVEAVLEGYKILGFGETVLAKSS